VTIQFVGFKHSCSHVRHNLLFLLLVCTYTFLKESGLSIAHLCAESLSAQHLMLESVRQMRKFIVMLYATAGNKFKTGITEVMFGKYEEEEDTLCD